MRAYLIAPVDRAIIEVDYDGVYTNIYGFIKADTFDIATFNEQLDAVFVDDMGLFKEDQSYFTIKGYAQPLAGRGLVLGVGPEGESTPPTVDMLWLQHNVRFQEI